MAMNVNGISENSHKLSKTWPYPRHSGFEKELRLAAKEWFESKGLKCHSEYPYCLDKWENWHHNIIDQEVVTFIKGDLQERKGKKGFPLHKYVHHGLSSQALLFNLLGPLVVRNDLIPLRQLLETKGIAWPDGKTYGAFEYEDRNVFKEYSGQPTSIDFIIQDSNDKPVIFIESKLAEREFGACSAFKNGDCDGRNPASNFNQCYLHHIGRQYWPLLKDHGFLDGPLKTEYACIFVSHYQFFREILFAIEKAGTFVLLSDNRSPTFFCNPKNGSAPRGLMEFLGGLIPEKVRHHIVNITIQELVQTIEKTRRHPWIEQFKVKYALK
jgi:POLQ-like helicase